MAAKLGSFVAFELTAESGGSDKLRPLWVATFHWTEVKRKQISKQCTIITIKYININVYKGKWSDNFMHSRRCMNGWNYRGKYGD